MEVIINSPLVLNLIDAIRVVIYALGCLVVIGFFIKQKEPKEMREIRHLLRKLLKSNPENLDKKLCRVIISINQAINEE